MKTVIIPVIASILILGTLATGFIPNAYAAQGTVVWINPAEKLGKIAEDGCEDESCYHPFQIPKDLADSDYSPQVGDRVTFDLGPGNTASNVALSSTVTIIFQDANNDPIPDALCRVDDSSGGFIFSNEGFTDENGQVTLFVDPIFTAIFVVCTQDDFLTFGAACVSPFSGPMTVVLTEGDRIPSINPCSGTV